jgi:catechol 2,3-dioxygenase-like lactoylglutathione lyase family enzyme
VLLEKAGDVRCFASINRIKKMRTPILLIAGLMTLLVLGSYSKTIIPEQPKNSIGKSGTKTIKEQEDHMKLGAFSISLSVKDLETSKEFYENLGFTTLGGGMEQNYLIMKNENSLIGLFQGMFEGNILTFNPGWDENGKNIDKFNDVREIQKHLKSKGIALISEADEKTSGPASLMVKDPDGNLILVDQHR